jgi:amino acid transporter
MIWKQLFARKTLETLHAEAAGENRLRRVLGPISLTSLGIGAIIGAGIFVMTGRVAAVDAGPAVMLSFVVAGFGCVFAAFCYAEFASMAPVAGSAYTYAYATLGEMFAWIIGWDLILEYAMACAVVAAGWTHYLNEFVKVFVEVVSGHQYTFSIPTQIGSDPFSTTGAWFNLPAVFIILACTVILVIGIRESATTNAVLVAVKVGVVLFVIAVGFAFVSSDNWTKIDPADRILPEERVIPDLVEKEVKEGGKLSTKEVTRRVNQIGAAVRDLYHQNPGLAPKAVDQKVEAIKQQILTLYWETAKLPEDVAKERIDQLKKEAIAAHKINYTKRLTAELQANGKMTSELAKEKVDAAVKKYGKYEPKTEVDRILVGKILAKAQKEGVNKATEKWGLLGEMGIDKELVPIDNATRSPFAPYGLSGIIFGASIVFFAYIGFDAISTHSEEAVRPQRDVPIGILASLGICTVLYILVSAVITGMIPYPDIDQKAAVASAFSQKAKVAGDSLLLNMASLLISTGALAGLTSVLLITFLSQARIFLAMARDGLLPPRIFGAIHERFRTPHISTMLTGSVIAVVAAFTPITDLEEMVNIGTLMAFVIVCAAVLLLRIREPNAHRPFRTPFLFVLAPLGIGVNLLMMLFLPPLTWLRLVVWLAVGLAIYFSFGVRHSTVGKELAYKQSLAGNGDI